MNFEDQFAQAQRAYESRAYESLYRKLSNQFGGNYTPPPVPVAVPLEHIMILFVRSLPYDAAKVAYRKAATMLHPDVTHDNGEAMKMLNTAWARIEKEFYGK